MTASNDSLPRLARPLSRPARGGRPGFTLTELLVVIALIVLLVALLLTALGGVQQKSRETKTVSTMQAFSNACEAFYQEHNFYPGLVPEGVLTNSMAPQMSGTENAVLHLVGGGRGETDDGYDELEPPGNPCGPDGWTELTIGEQNPNIYNIKVNPSRFGEGPVIRGRAYAPYLTLTGKELGAVAGQPAQCQSGDLKLELPEVLDAWGQPIIYLRRQRTIGPLVQDGSDAPPQFGISPCAQYLEMHDPQQGLGKLGQSQIENSIMMTGNGPRTLEMLLAHPALSQRNQGGPGYVSATPRGAFMLVSAGSDGVFFSRTDGAGSPGNPVDDITDPDAYPATVLEEYDDVVMFGGGG